MALRIRRFVRGLVAFKRRGNNRPYDTSESSGLVFGIGLGKTGTKSLASALEILGYRCLHDAARVTQEINADRAAGRPLLSNLVGTYSAFADHPIWRCFPELDEIYPGSKFLWTVRDLDSWLDSRKRHIEYRTERIRRGEPNVPTQTRFDEKRQRDIYTKHDAQVREFFTGRERDLLELAICDGDGWDKLCPFLHKSIPDLAFPWRSEGSDHRPSDSDVAFTSR